MKILQIISEEIATGTSVIISDTKSTRRGSRTYKKTYVWNGTNWTYNGTPVSDEIAKKINASDTVKNIKKANKTTGKLSINNESVTSQQVGKNKFVVTFKDTDGKVKSVRFTDPKLAAGAAKSIRGGSTLAQVTNLLPKDSFKVLNFGNKWTSMITGSAMTKEQIARYIQKIKDNPKAPGAQRFLAMVNGPVWSSLAKFAGIAGFSYLLYQTFVINYDIVSNTPSEEFENGESEKENLLDVITGLFVSQVVLGLVAVFRLAKTGKTFINLIRAPIRAIQAGALVTGVGTVPAIISIILSETAFFIALTALANPTVQLKLAEWVASWWASNLLFATIGNVTDVTMKTLDSLTDGAIGGDTLRDAIGFKKGVAKMPAGTAWASSEWAKLAFQDLIFPPDMNKIKVPWLMPAQRKTAIFDALEMKAPSSSQDAQPTITPATDPYAEPGRPGGMNTPPPAPPQIDVDRPGPQ